MNRITSTLVSTTRKVAEVNVNSACFWFIYQPRIPEILMKKLKK